MSGFIKKKKPLKVKDISAIVVATDCTTTATTSDEIDNDDVVVVVDVVIPSPPLVAGDKNFEDDTSLRPWTCSNDNETLFDVVSSQPVVTMQKNAAGTNNKTKRQNVAIAVAILLPPCSSGDSDDSGNDNDASPITTTTSADLDTTPPCARQIWRRGKKSLKKRRIHQSWYYCSGNETKDEAVSCFGGGSISFFCHRW